MRGYFEIQKLIDLLLPLLDKGSLLTDSQLEEKSIKLREQLKKMGPTFVRLGQMLGTRYDLLRSATCRELQHLLNHKFPASSFESIVENVREQLGGNSNQIAAISKDPIAASVFNEVYLAQLVDKQKIVIKIQKQGIRETVEDDLRLLKLTLKITFLKGGIRKFKLQELIKNLSQQILKETDLNNEALMIIKYKEASIKDSQILIPTVIKELSNNSILTTRYVGGINSKEYISAFEWGKRNKDIIIKGVILNRDKLLKTLIANQYQGIFMQKDVFPERSLADTILITDEKIGYTDFNNAYSVSLEDTESIKKIIATVLSGSAEAIARALIAVDQKIGSFSPEDILTKLHPYFYDLELEGIAHYGSTKLLMDMVYNASRVDIEIPIYIVNFLNVLLNFEKLVQLIRPDTTFMEELAIYGGIKIDSIETKKIIVQPKPAKKESKFWLVFYIGLILISFAAIIVTIALLGPQSLASLIMLGAAAIIILVSLFKIFKD